VLDMMAESEISPSSAPFPLLVAARPPRESTPPTVAMPRGRPSRRVSVAGLDEEVLSSRDLSVIGPVSSRRGARLSGPVADPLIGMIVADRYRIVEPLGRGGMGIVYKVEHTRIGKLLAMKLLTGELSHNPEVVRRFKREALTVSKLQSPNTVQVFDFGVSDGLTYLVMELVSGETLTRALSAHGPMPFSRLGKIVVQLCSSLAEAHRKGIVHRDIKPDNIMLVPAEGADLAKVLDFGLAKLRETEGLCDVTGQGMILGTPYYMAPEQIRGGEIDARTDVYGIGALMYRALTGFHPFSGTPMAVMQRHLNEAPIPPAERAPELGIPPGVSRLVMRALRKDPRGRFQTIEDLQRLLVEEIRAGGSPSVDGLLDSGELRRLSRAVPPEGSDAMATRDEVDAYERTLRRKRYGALVAAAVALASAVGAGVLVPRDARFGGVEIEPNDTAAEATAIPLGQAARGQIGKRIDASHGDRDFYAFDLPAPAAGPPAPRPATIGSAPPASGGSAAPPGAQAFLGLRVSGLPSLAMCTMIYRPGFADAVGQYCVGRAGRDLVIPALRLDPGRYFLAVLQDGSVDPAVHETISDSYTVLAESTIPGPGIEIEPNDRIASATALAPGAPCSAAIGWARDEDVFCVPAEVPAPIRWKVRAGFRDSGALEATPIQGGEEGAPVRIHPDERGRTSDADTVSPWRSAPIAADTVSPRCLRVRLATDPWSPERAAGVPSGGTETYVVEAEVAP
jgi:serine/threonine-protein kinase